MVLTRSFDGFTINIYLYDEGDYLAYFVELPTVSAFAVTPEDALIELAESWAGVKQSYLSKGEAVPVASTRKEYSGNFNIRIDKRIHRALSVEAQQAGI